MQFSSPITVKAIGKYLGESSSLAFKGLALSNLEYVHMPTQPPSNLIFFFQVFEGFHHYFFER